jgi:rRNA maturation endonuclease Nob1
MTTSFTVTFCGMANWLRRCHECNFPLGKKDVFCPRCGAKQRRDKIMNQRYGDKVLCLKSSSAQDR